MILLNAELFFGHFHPLLVHLPIGFLLLAVLLEFAGYSERYKAIRIAVPFALLLGCISAAASCITGYILSLSGDYNTDILDTHMWAGIITTVAAFITYLISIKKIPSRFFRSTKALGISLAVMLILVSAAGHLGGSLTHGADYISSSVLFDNQKKKANIASISDAMVFEDVVHPILQNKCGDCHNKNKMKGQLSMESLAAIVKGGKHGPVMVKGKPSESEIIKRVSLPHTDKKFMPSDGNPPLTDEETAIIKWWIEKVSSGPDKKIPEAAPPVNIQNFIATYLGLPSNNSSVASSGLPLNFKAPEIREADLAALKQSGFVIKYISLKPDLLDVTLPSPGNKNTSADPDKIKQLLAVKDNIIWLNIAGNNIVDNQMDIVAQFKNIQRLRLDKNPVSDAGITKLKALNNIQSINLCNTDITKNCIADLSKIKTLRTAYVWGTKILKQDIAAGNDSTLKIITGL